MPTHQLLNGLSGNLQSSTAWAQQQALELIQRNVLQALDGLAPQEKNAFCSCNATLSQPWRRLKPRKSEWSGPSRQTA